MTILPRHKDVAKSRLKMSNPWHLLAVGFGSGLSPIVPGTMGSLAAIPFWYLMTFLPWQLYSLVVMLGICIGVYLCHQTAKDMGVHDHGSIVWDEFIGMWITLMALPTNDWQWVAAGFVIFRILAPGFVFTASHVSKYAPPDAGSQRPSLPRFSARSRYTAKRYRTAPQSVGRQSMARR